jgi:hypothetical protein
MNVITRISHKVIYNSTQCNVKKGSIPCLTYDTTTVASPCPTDVHRRRSYLPTGVGRLGIPPERRYRLTVGDGGANVHFCATRPIVYTVDWMGSPESTPGRRTGDNWEVGQIPI